MKNVSILLEQKGRDVWTIAPDAMVYDAIALMAEKGIGALMVMDGDKLIGIVTERDYAREVILKGRRSKETPVRDIMTDRVFCVPLTRTVDECMALMTEKRIRHLPVVDEGKVCGLVSIGDVVRGVIVEKEILIEQLENYILGR